MSRVISYVCKHLSTQQRVENSEIFLFLFQKISKKKAPNDLRREIIVNCEGKKIDGGRNYKIWLEGGKKLENTK